MIRGGHFDLVILGAMRVTDRSANWMVPGKMLKGQGDDGPRHRRVKRVVLMEHAAKGWPGSAS